MWRVRTLLIGTVFGGVAAIVVGGSSLALASSHQTAPTTGRAHSKASGSDTAASRIVAQQAQRKKDPHADVTTWSPVESGPAARSIVLNVSPKLRGCPVGPARVQAKETATRIVVRVDQRYQDSSTCSFVLTQHNYTVQLAGPIAGRQITGIGLLWPKGALYLHKSEHGAGVPLTPRLIGFSGEQAIKTLAAQGFHGVIRKGGSPASAVIAQTPARGQIPADSRATDPGSGFAGSVTLTTQP